ncbi:hypothetical protein ONS96_004814 [Cadophora gregata f. sp. sojae]|nr:hypothetical protein ONS96_004814 [Cadophora gregata f. sp. sojae]
MPPSNNFIEFSSIPAPRKAHELHCHCLSSTDCWMAFHRFSDLPAELRHMVWKFSLPEPRRIVYLQRKNVQGKACLRVRSDCEVGSEKGEKKFFQGTNLIDLSVIRHPDGYDIPGNHIRPKSFGFRSNTVIPIATVCQESRAIVSQRFTLAFGSENFPPTTWFDFRTDTLYLDWGFSRHGFEEWRSSKNTSWRFSRHDLSSDVRKVHRLALNDGFEVNTELVPYEDFDMRRENYAEWVHDILETFGHVKQLTYVDADMTYRARSRSEVRELVDMGGIVDINEIIDQVHMIEKRAEYHPAIMKAIRQANSDRTEGVLRSMPGSWRRLGDLRVLDTVEGLAKRPKYQLPKHMRCTTITTKRRADRCDAAMERCFQLSDEYFVRLTVRVVFGGVTRRVRVGGRTTMLDIINIARKYLGVGPDRTVRSMAYVYKESHERIREEYVDHLVKGWEKQTILSHCIPPGIKVEYGIRFRCLE